MSNNFKISIILGPAFKFDNQLTKIIKKYINKKDEVIIYKNINNISEMMINTDLVITSPGTTIFESFSIGVPTIAFFQNSFEREIFSGFVLCYELNKIENLKNFLFTIYSDYYQNKKTIDKLEVATGKNEIIKNILGGYTK
jgi:spore coat polysaccharide biosynthesis predicted glycosyltransferase SpsG